MRRAIVHLGMPRTGSTTLQHILARHRNALLDRGVLYPDLTPCSAAVEPHINHQHLGEALDGRRPASEGRELLGRLSDLLAGTRADTVLLSYEDFIQERRAAPIASTLAAAFARHDFQMECVVVVKPQGEMLNSMYAHRVQLMREHRLFARYAAAFERSGRFDYGALALPWAVACGGRVRGVALRDARSAAPLVQRFADAAALSSRAGPLLGRDDVTRVENRSPGPVAVEVSRRLRLGRVPAQLSVRPRVMMRAIEAAASAGGLDAVPFKGIDAAGVRRMATLHANTNARFAALAFDAPWDTVVAGDAAAQVNEIGGRPTDPDTERTIGAIMQECCERFGAAPKRILGSRVLDWLGDKGNAAQRRFGMGGWRVE